MVDVKSKRCAEINCKIKPSYNYEGEKAKYCFEHSQKNMINVISKKCIEPNCKKIPTYNYEGEKALYCIQHSKKGMIDVANPKCIEKNCNIRPNYNYEGQKALYCLNHRRDDMVDVTHPKCKEIGCKTRPTYNFKGNPPKYCVMHKHPNMYDVGNKMCKNEWCLTQVRGKYDGYCLYCYINLFPDKPVTRNYKTKEYAVVEYIKSKFENLSWLSDKKIIDGCSRRRPDLFIDLGDQIIIVEIDENQHDTYDCSCENKRLMELSTDVGHRPIVFIRFNPDEYIENKNNIASCWSINNNGICVVKNNKKKEWEQRLKQLEETINYWLINRTDKTIEIVHLFYDSL